MISLYFIFYYLRYAQVPLDEKLRFILRIVFFRLFNDCPLSQFLKANIRLFDPELVCKFMEMPQRLFYDKRLNYTQRSTLVRDHCEFMKHQFPESINGALLQFSTFCLAHIVGKSGKSNSLNLRFDFQMEKEGCLNIELTDISEPIIRCAFHISKSENNSDGSPYVLKLGCVQSTNSNTLEKLKETTKDFYGLQPRIFVFDALKIFCNFLKIDRIEGISSEDHVYNSDKYKKEYGFNYDELWTFLGLIQQADGNFQGSSLLHLKNIDEYPSRKRSEYKHRYELIAQVQHQIGQIESAHTKSN